MGAVIAILAMALAPALLLWPSTETFYTDADTINQPAATARIRDILWRPPTRLPNLINSNNNEYEPRLSADGMTLLFVRGKAGENADIYVCGKTLAGWETPRPLVEINTEYDELGPEPSADGRALYFYSDRPGGEGGYDLWVAHRGLDGRSTYGEALNLGPAVNSEFNDYGPAVSPDGTTLYFASNRPREDEPDQPQPDAWPGTIREDLYRRTYDLYGAPLTEQGIGAAHALYALNTSYNEGAPCVSPFTDFLYFASDRPGGEGGFDLYRARRLSGELREPTNLGQAINTAANELDPGLTMGGFALYFSSDRPVEASEAPKPLPYHIYQSTSREVFARADTHRRSINWAALWSSIAPNLFWALLALLLLTLLFVLLRDLKGRRLSLLARCLLASLGLHLLLMLLFNAWEVTIALAHGLRERGAIQIALLAPAKGDDLSAQIRGEFTTIETPPPSRMAVKRQVTAIEFQSTPTLETLSVARRPLESEDCLTPDRRITDARITSSANDTPPRHLRFDDTVPVTLDVIVPPAWKRASVPETTSPPPQPLPINDVERPPINDHIHECFAATKQATIPPQADSSTRQDEPVRSLADPPAPRDATPRVSITAPAKTIAASFERIAEIPLAVPQAEPHRARTDEQVASAPKAAPHQPAPIHRSSVTPPPAEDPGPAIAEVAVSHQPVNLTELGFCERTAPQAIDARALSTESRASRNPIPSLPNLPPAGLALPTLDESASTSGEPQPAKPDQATRCDLRRAMDGLFAARPLGDSRPFEVPPTQRRAHAIEDPSLVHQDPLLPDLAVPDTLGTAVSPQVRAVDLPAPPTPGLRLPREVILPDDPFSQRSPQFRLAVAEGMGGSLQTETAVQLALRWLARHQSPDGRWDGDGFDEGCHECGGETHISADVALTGLSLLCFLGANHTHTDEGPYQENVARALQWLVNRQSPNGDLRAQETMYSQGIATIALAEAYGMTGDSRLHDPVDRAVRFIEAARDTRVGGWRYDPGQPGDTSVLGWQIMALKSARSAGISVDMEAFVAAQDWLDKVSSPAQPGLYAYQPTDAPSPAMTAEGLLVQQILGRRVNEPRMRQSVAYLLEHLPYWDDSPNTYYWYYATMALFNRQGEPWRRWNEVLTEQLLDRQRKEGPAAGSWNPEGEWAETGGRVYQTALCTLMLEVYYRYLPLFLRERPADAIGTIRGTVTDAATGEPISGAVVRLELIAEEPIEVFSIANGTYTLHPPEVPTFFALSASSEGYLPTSKNVATAMVQGTTLDLDFALKPRAPDSVALEDEPQVHHLGDNAFEGRVNSQFQRESEGATFTAEFNLTAEQLTPETGLAELTMLVKGVQMRHRVLVNGHLIGPRLDWSPRDGSFGTIALQFDPALLQIGTNTLRIIASARGSDIDDFEFVNMQIRLLLRKMVRDL